MGGSVSKTWNEMNEVNDAATEEEKKSKEAKNRGSLRNRLRTRILRTDPRSVTEDVSRTPIAVEKNEDTPLKTLVQDPRSPGMTGLDRTPIVVVAEDAKNPLRGAVPPNFELPPMTPSSDSFADSSDPRSPAYTGPRTPLVTSTPTTIPLAVKDKSQPSCILADRLRGEALAALRDQQQNEVSMTTAPSAEARTGHNDSSLLI